MFDGVADFGDDTYRVVYDLAAPHREKLLNFCANRHLYLLLINVPNSSSLSLLFIFVHHLCFQTGRLPICAPILRGSLVFSWPFFFAFSLSFSLFCLFFLSKMNFLFFEYDYLAEFFSNWLSRQPINPISDLLHKILDIRYWDGHLKTILSYIVSAVIEPPNIWIVSHKCEIFARTYCLWTRTA